MTRIAVTIGDPAGIGPEIILKTARSLDAEPFDLVVYGARALLDWTAERLPGLAPFEGEVVEVGPSIDEPAFGIGTAQGARLQHAALVKAVEDALSGAVAAIVTAPWTKHTLQLAGLPATGHTEVLAACCAVERPTMMLCGDTMRVALVTTHLPLAKVAGALTADHITHHLVQLHEGLTHRFSIDAPRIAVCGLNPHAGEAGAMGDEEQRIIVPAILAATSQGVDACGPFAADTLFARVARTGEYDAVLAMYHDQGLIPLKLWHFGAAANVTLGLPIVRTSVDHGTAYDIAGKGVADPSSMIYAVRLAVRMAGAHR